MVKRGLFSWAELVTLEQQTVSNVALTWEWGAAGAKRREPQAQFVAVPLDCSVRSVFHWV